MTKRLWLFDVDGTLVDTTLLHVVAYRKAYAAVTGHVIPDALIVQRFGMPATKGHDIVLRAAGVVYSDAMISEIVVEHQAFFAAETKKARIIAFNGVVELLQLLKTQGNVLGVVTGNFQKPTENILANAGLLSFFSFLSCDSGHDDRIAIVKRGIALGRKYGITGTAIVVGDTPSDVRAGKAAGAATVAVATGVFSVADLKKEKPTMVVKNLQQIDAANTYIKYTGRHK